MCFFKQSEQIILITGIKRLFGKQACNRIALPRRQGLRPAKNFMQDRHASPSVEIELAHSPLTELGKEHCRINWPEPTSHLLDEALGSLLMLGVAWWDYSKESLLGKRQSLDLARVGRLMLVLRPSRPLNQ